VADQTLAQRADRWNDIVILSKSVANIDGQGGDFWLLPAGIGDVAIMEVMVEFSQIDVVKTAYADAGVAGFVQNAARDTTVDFIGNAKFTLKSDGANALGLSAYLSPDPLVLMRQDEVLLLQWPEVDTDATPTADVAVIVKAVRVRPLEGTVSGPIRLVR